MTLLTEERVRIGVDRDRIWPIFSDAEALARVLPGCEQLHSTGPNVYRGVLATRLQFLTIRADVTARLLDLEPPARLSLEIDGRPRGLAGGFRAVIPIGLEEDDGGTAVSYRVELTTSGRLASFGAPLLRDTFRRQVATLVANLEAELPAPMSGSPKGLPPEDPG
jgi:carbon monoxide dehydrogenase subunit G